VATVDRTLMGGLKPHDRRCDAELPRYSDLRRIGEPANSGREGPPDRGCTRAPPGGGVSGNSPPGASLRCYHGLFVQPAAGGTRRAKAR